MGLRDDPEERLDRLMAQHRYAGSALIEVLHAAQELYGYLSRRVMQAIAHKLNLPPSKVLGVATFYHLFRFAQPRQHTAVICLGTACYVAGGMDLMNAARHKYANGQWTIEGARCIGSCGLAPVVICDDHALGRVTALELESRIGTQAKV